MNNAFERARAAYGTGAYDDATLEFLFPQLKESEDERIRKWLVGYFTRIGKSWIHREFTCNQIIAYLEKQKENSKSADFISSNCASGAKCEDRWHKVGDSLPDNGRLVLANDCLGNTLLARYDGEGNWEVSVYDNDDYYCRNTITKWCEIPSEKQKEQKLSEVNLEKEVEKYLLDNADFVTKSTSKEMVNTLARHFAEWGRKQVLQEIYDGKVKPVDKITAAWLDDE